MVWNGIPYIDHPPMGFWITAVSYKLFGISEFTTRLPSAFLGVLTVFLMFEVGRLLSGKKEVGFAASLILGTSVWYVIRVRSGNLDGYFIFFTVLTVYTSIRAQNDFRWFPAATAAGACLFMTKTLVGAVAAPLILFLTAGQLIQVKKNWRLILAGIVTASAIILPWYSEHFSIYPDFYQKHFVRIGARNKTSLQSYLQLYWEQPMFYLHMGIRKWYYPWFLGIAGLLFSIMRKKRIWQAVFLLMWNALVLYPFLTAQETELWHLIPVYVPIALIIAVGLSAINPLGKYAYIVGVVLIAVLQIKTFYPEVFPANKYTPSDVAIAQAAAKYDKQIYLDDDFFPIAVFYTNKRVLPLYDMGSFGQPPEINTMVELFESDRKDFVVITREWAMDNLEVANIPYTVLEENEQFAIVARPETTE